MKTEVPGSGLHEKTGWSREPLSSAVPVALTGGSDIG